MNGRHAWTLARIASGLPVNGEVDELPEGFRTVARSMLALPDEHRRTPLDAFLKGRPDEEAIIRAIADADPEGEAPEGPGHAESGERWATGADIRRLQCETRWAWKGWMQRSGIIGIAGCEGTGKTRFALDLCRRIYSGDSWPDGQPASYPIGTKSVWLCADGHHGELVETMDAFGLPDEAVYFPAPASDPYGGTDLDSDETLSALESVVAAHQPGLVVLDTLTYATGKDLCSQAVMKGLKSPLLKLAQEHGVLVVLLLHVSREGQAYGRRIKGLTRTLLHLEASDPQNAPGRLRLWVEKSYAEKPPPLGVTMSATGNAYDFNPPSPRELDRGGRPPEAREKAAAFIVDALTSENDRIGNELCRDFEATGGNSKTFWRAVGDLEKDGRVAKNGGTGTGKQVVLHLLPAPG